MPVINSNNMKDKLITRWNELRCDYRNVDFEYVWPMVRDMDRIAKVLKYRYNFIVSF